MSLLELSRAILADLAGEDVSPDGRFAEAPEVSEESEESPPDRSAWRSIVATWDIRDRQRWADIAEAHQDSGDPWNVAEWRAYQEMTA